MTDSSELLLAVNEIRDLLRLLAEPAIAERDARLRSELRKAVGSSAAHKKCVLLMDGTRTQKSIHAATGAHQGNLSTLVKTLAKAELLSGDPKKPKLVISIPSSFFDQSGKSS